MAKVGGGGHGLSFQGRKGKKYVWAEAGGEKSLTEKGGGDWCGRD